MPIYTSVLKLDKPIGTPPHQVAVSIYSSPHGGYIRVSEIDANNGSDATFTSALMSADECRALARSLDAMASVLEQSEKNDDMS
ncbi:hypothetical protein SJS40_20355 [Aeromonas caviae]|uniref:hypothetical protein n=1 Tax=Aeromonas caviae TaxID=648 RepID=UPI0029D734F2|nr:hypothetical protein [Aeromonas caviae]MDX7755857.1 hypothetical protein [Aeromonas caviae]MDX7775897.1 hypothetical protein [Aeromonas caviae]